jgi:3-hydroxybutyryl-CoA dehydrogenase
MDGDTAAGIARIAVVGGGTMGAVIGLEFALAGYAVRLREVGAEQIAGARQRAAAAASALVAHGFATADGSAAAEARMEFTASLDDAVAGAGYVVEAISEDLAAKQALFARLDALCAPPVVLASNTSSLPAGAIASAARRPERVLVTHYFNPPYLLPLVELVRHETTDGRSVAVAQALLRRAGKRVAVIQKDVPGMVGNRLQAALLREACALVDAGVISMEDLDVVVSAGFGRRLGVLGPFAVADLAGLDIYRALLTNVLPDLSAATTPSPLLAERVARGALGAKTGRGFFDWPPERLAEAVSRRDGALFSLRQRDMQAGEGQGGDGGYSQG